jgi:hypothetical protein
MQYFSWIAAWTGLAGEREKTSIRISVSLKLSPRIVQLIKGGS